jgi:hypothetical protein
MQSGPLTLRFAHQAKTTPQTARKPRLKTKSGQKTPINVHGEKCGLGQQFKECFGTTTRAVVDGVRRQGFLEHRACLLIEALVCHWVHFRQQLSGTANVWPEV